MMMSHGSLSNSLVPFVFVVLAAMTALVAIALVILTCFHTKSTEGNHQLTITSLDRTAEKPVVAPLDMEPRIAVVMAGDEHPSFLAKPLYSSLHHKQQRAMSSTV